MKSLRDLLLPFSWLYSLGVHFRNWLFDHEILPVRTVNVPVIGIGNLSVGGTGKTPMAEYLLKLLLERDFEPALLSRGYGRKTKGFHLVKPDSSAETAGDEPYQIKRKFPDVTVAVCEERAHGIEQLLKINPAVNVIVLDDALQHRKVKSDITILLTSFDRPYYEDKILPAGRLREPLSGKRRSNIIIMTKCPPGLHTDKKKELTEKLRPLPHQKVYFTSIGYRWLMQANSENSQRESILSLDNIKGFQIVLFTGIANPQPLLEYLHLLGIKPLFHRFADHHIYSNSDLEKIIHTWKSIEGKNKLLLTTEKDWRRLEHSKSLSLFHNIPLYYLPIEVEFLGNENNNFDTSIIKYLNSKTDAAATSGGR